MAKDKKPEKQDTNGKTVAQNRKARFNYFIDETIEAGIVLTGTEVKSLRSGQASIQESYASVEGSDIFLINATEAERDGLVSAVLSGASRTKQLERMRFAAEHGYSAYEAEGAGLTGIAVPVWAGNEICAALALSGPSTRFSVKNAESWLADMRIAAKRLEPWMDAD